MEIKYTGTFLLLIFLMSSAFSQENEWKLKKDKHGIQVFVRDSEDSPIKEYLALMEVSASTEECWKIMDEVDNHPEWMAKIKHAEKLSENPDGSNYTYYQVDFPFPFDDRDLILFISTVSTKNPTTIRINIEDRADHIPVKKKLKRLTGNYGYWEFTATEDNTTSVKYQFRSDGGGMPGWLVNLFIVQTPFETMLNMKKRLTQ